jgi:hypothetical protein
MYSARFETLNWPLLPTPGQPQGAAPTLDYDIQEVDQVRREGFFFGWGDAVALRLRCGREAEDGRPGREDG